MLHTVSRGSFALSALAICISSTVGTTTANAAPKEETLVVTANRAQSSLWESPATIQVIDQQTLKNATSTSIADDLQDIPGVEVTDNSLAGRKQIRIRGEASSRVLILIDGRLC